MVYTRRRKTFKKRRNPRRKNYNKVVINRGPVAKSTIVRMRYCDEVDLDPGAAVAATHVFSCTGLYDPDVTGTGHQPLGFDQWMQFYDHYTVLGAKISVTALNNNTGDAFCVGLVVKDSLTAITEIPRLKEQSSNYKYIARAGSKDMVSLSRKFSTKKFFSKGHVMDDPELKGTISTNPTEQAYFHLWCCPFDEASDEGTLRCNVQIDYIVQLSEPGLIPTS